MEEYKRESNEGFDELEKRKKNIVNFLKKSGNWVYYAILTVILAISVYIRTLNIPKLKDITNGTWTLGPDLDPFLFLRWAKYIAEHGKLFLLDTMRSVPLAEICSGQMCDPINTAGEMKLLSYMIVLLHKFLSIFSQEADVTYAAIIFPVVMAVATGIIFFLFTRKLFEKEGTKISNIIALVSTAFFVLVPSLLPRTIAGIPEKESAAFFFLFAAFYFFLEADTTNKLKKGLIFGLLAGIMTGLLGLIWGGVTFAFMVISGAVLISFFLKHVDGKKFLYYLIWLASSSLIMMFFSTRYNLASLVSSVSTGISFFVLFILIIDFLIYKKNIFKVKDLLSKIKLPEQLMSLILTICLTIILASIVFGISFIPSLAQDVISHSINPFTQSRFGITVAENKQPYFTSDWSSEFGPVILNLPVYFWLFFIGAVYLFSHTIKSLTKKEKIIMNIGYTLFLFCLIFSKYSSTSLLNGESGLSIFVYFLGVILFTISIMYVSLKRHRGQAMLGLTDINFSYVFYTVLLTIMVVAARGAIRLVMVLGAVSPIAIGFLVVMISQKYLKEKEDSAKLFAGVVAIIIILASLFTLWTYYQSEVYMAENYAPSSYTQQWQKAMSWVRENTPLAAVFAHWWDYGYWVQSIGERATILDGGNAVGYWNYFMGRNVLTGDSELKALDFLYAHKGTHLLIDSSDIGKYGAFSSIGSNSSYDRYSWIPNLLLDETQIQEKNNETIYVYPAGTVAIDEDISFEQDGKEILLPRKKAVIAAVILREGLNGSLLQPIVYIVYNNKQYPVPLRYVYLNGEEYDFKTGLDAGIFVFPSLKDNNGQISVSQLGAMLYLSQRTIHSGVSRLYLNDKPSDYFKLVHTESSMVVDSLRQQGVNVGEFVYYQGLQGPIKIWEISYPEDITLDESYLSIDYPEELAQVSPGEY